MTITPLHVTYINIVLYALCYQLQRPIEPFLVQQLSKNAASADVVATTYGQLQAFFSFIQTIGSPLVGIILDRLGIRTTSAIVFGSSALSYWILAMATEDMSMLFYSKIPTAFQHAFLVAQAVAATSCVNDDAARAQALGRMTTAYTIGATVGPALGGYLAERGGMYFAAKLAVFGSILSVVLSFLFLPGGVDTNTNSSNAGTTKRIVRGKSFYDEIQNTVSMAIRSNLWPLLVVKVFGGVAASMYQTTIPILLTQDLKMDPSSLGLYMSSSMFAVAIFGAIGMSPLIQMIGSTGMTSSGLIVRAILGCVMALTISNALQQVLLETTTTIDSATMYSYITSWQTQIIIVSVLHALASHALATGVTTQTTGVVNVNEQGSLLGLEHGLFSMARIVGPPAGTYVLLWSGGNSFWTIAIVCAIIDIMMLSLLNHHPMNYSHDTTTTTTTSTIETKNLLTKQPTEEEKTK